MLTELQKAAKEGGDDELAVLRRERKRRLESATAFRDAGRDELADGEEAEARLIEAYLPAELSDDELRAIVAAAIAETGAPSPKDMGQVMKAAMAEVDGRADGKRVSALVREALAADASADRALQRGRGRARRQRRRRPARARGPRRVRALPARQRRHARRRAEAVDAAATVVRELAELIEQGHEIAPGTIAAVTGALDQHASPAEILEDVVWRHRSKQVAPKTVNQKRYVDSIRNNTITFGIGPAGTGKTFLAVALAAAALSRREVNRIILTRPAVEAGERLGFLPGDLMAKIDPYLRPLFDALHDMLDAEKVATYLERGQIEVAPLAFMRGRTLNDSFIILDEAQNTTPEQMKMFLTRLGFNSKMVVTGDITQIDLPKHEGSGLVVVGDILEDIEGIDFVRFGGEDVVRHRLVQRIVEAYAEHAESRTPELRPADRRRALEPLDDLEIDVVGRRAGRPAARGDRAAARRSRSPRRASTTATSRSSSSAPSGSPSSTPSTAARPARPTSCRSRSTATDPVAGPARARRHRHLPRAHRRPARGDRPRRAAPDRHGPRDRRRRDARRAARDPGLGHARRGP